MPLYNSNHAVKNGRTATSGRAVRAKYFRKWTTSDILMYYRIYGGKYWPSMRREAICGITGRKAPLCLTSALDGSE